MMDTPIQNQIIKIADLFQAAWNLDGLVLLSFTVEPRHDSDGASLIQATLLPADDKARTCFVEEKQNKLTLPLLGEMVPVQSLNTSFLIRLVKDGDSEILEERSAVSSVSKPDSNGIASG